MQKNKGNNDNDFKNLSTDWEEYWKTQPSDEELEAMGIEISEDEDFFDEMDKMIKEIFIEKQ